LPIPPTPRTDGPTAAALALALAGAAGVGSGMAGFCCFAKGRAPGAGLAAGVRGGGWRQFAGALLVAPHADRGGLSAVAGICRRCCPASLGLAGTAGLAAAGLS